MSLSTLQCKDALWFSFHRPAPSLELQLAHSKYVGEVTLSLKYVTSDNVNITDINQVVSCGELRIWVKEARHLPSSRLGSQPADPYVKLCLLPDRSAKSKRKTPPVQKSCSPVWNLVLKFENMSVRELHSRALELTVWDNYRLVPGKKVFLGGVVLHFDRDNFSVATATAAAPSQVDRRSPSPKSPMRVSDEVRMWRTVLERHNVWVDGNLLLWPSMPKHHLLSD
ncbi:hypothetical protein BOX15_Mlig003666g1 [Macrostomum lignano]|nr:hypothetical protein BOX15_Mlig003666g1 [Macrostomum lignano]